MVKNFFLFTFEIIKIIIISLVIIVPIRYFLIQPFYVRGASMEPNFNERDYLIVDEISYKFNNLKRGDIVVFRYPRNPKEYFIKRVIGLPGEKVQIKDGKVIIFNKQNEKGIALEEPYLSGDTNTVSMNEDVIAIADNEYFLLGDNRTQSKDSRSFGPVNKSYITGRVLFRGLPLNKVKFFSTFNYSY